MTTPTMAHTSVQKSAYFAVGLRYSPANVDCSNLSLQSHVRHLTCDLEALAGQYLLAFDEQNDGEDSFHRTAGGERVNIAASPAQT